MISVTQKSFKRSEYAVRAGFIAFNVLRNPGFLIILAPAFFQGEPVIKRCLYIMAAALMLVGSLVPPAISQADEKDDLSPPRLSLLLLRTLAYDARLKAKSPRRILVTVLFPSSGDATVCESVRSALQSAAAETTVSGLPVEITRHVYQEPSGLGSLLESSGSRVLFVCAGLEKQVPAIVQITRKQGVLTFTGERNLVTAGVSVGLVAKETKPVIVVNLPAAKAEDADFSMELLRLAEVIR